MRKGGVLSERQRLNQRLVVGGGGKRKGSGPLPFPTTLSPSHRLLHLDMMISPESGDTRRVIPAKSNAIRTGSRVRFAKGPTFDVFVNAVEFAFAATSLTGHAIDQKLREWRFWAVNRHLVALSANILDPLRMR